MRKLAVVFVLGAALGAPAAAHAQAIPDRVRLAGVTVQQWQQVQAEVRRAAAARGASERALAAVAERVSVNLVVNGRVDLPQLLTSIDQRAQQLAELQSQLASMERADDPTIAALLSQARTAIYAGELTRGDQLLAQAAQSDLATIARAQARLAPLQTRAAATIAERARLAKLGADYLGAARLYAQAAETAPASDPFDRWTYRRQQADCLRTRGELFGEPSALREAVRIHRDLAIPSLSRSTDAEDWATAQNDLGIALYELGSLGDNQALRDGVAAFRAALTVRTRERAPEDWASSQNNLGATLRQLGAGGDVQVLREAAAALRAALTVYTRESYPEDWAQAQSNLGVVLHTLASRGDSQAMRDAVAAHRAALTVYTRQNDPDAWATTQNNLGTALRTLGRIEPQALREAVAAHRAALTVRTRERAPAIWAGSQANLGNALAALGESGDAQALSEGAAAFQSALTVITRESSPGQWASIQVNMGNCLRALGVAGDTSALNQAVAAFRAALTVHTRERAPDYWATGQLSLSIALWHLAQRGDRARIPEAMQAARAALSGFQQTNHSYGIQQAQNMIGQLEAMR